MEEKKQKGFVVKDKRFFEEGGEARPEEIKETEPRKPSPEADERNQTEGPAHETGRDDFLTEVNFYNFVLSLSTTAMFHFGDFPDPQTNRAEKNLPAAKHTIDILSMLKEKTKGNLEDYENRLLDGILYELRVRYVREKG